jgi:hypothetical protein
MGAIDPGTLELRLSGVGVLPVEFDPGSKMMTCQVKKPLSSGAYAVIVAAKVNGQRAETRWNFNVSSTAVGAPPRPVAPVAPPAASPEPPAPGADTSAKATPKPAASKKKGKR